jgi:hypothetical protein
VLFDDVVSAAYSAAVVSAVTLIWF